MAEGVEQFVEERVCRGVARDGQTLSGRGARALPEPEIRFD